MARLQFKATLVLKMRLKAAWLRAVETRRDAGVEVRPFILTGPPRSGTSLLSALLSRKDNVLVSNEPVVLGDPLLARGDAPALVRGYANAVARQAVKHGTMSTKVDPNDLSKPTTDTAAKGAVRRDVSVDIDRNSPLCVGVKHPISFMEFLDELVDGWPELKVIVLARDPVPTIKSWRETTYGWQPALDDRKAGLWRRMYADVPKCDTPLERRAHLWRLLVERGLAKAQAKPGQVKFVRYEWLLDDAARVMRELFEHIGAPDAAGPIDVSDVRPQQRTAYKGFSEDEIAMIQGICGAVDARSLGGGN